MAFNTNGAATAGPKGLFSTDPLDVRLQVKLKSDLGDIEAGSVYESIRVFCQEDKKFYTPKNFDTTAPSAYIEWQEVTEGGDPLPDDFTNVKYTSKEAEIDWSNPAWSTIDATVYEGESGYFMTFTTNEMIVGNEDNNGACVAIYDLDEVIDYVMFTPDAIPLNGFSDVKAGVWYKATDYDDYGLYTGLEEVERAEVIAFSNSIEAQDGWNVVDHDLYDYFTAEILTEKAPVDVTFGEKFAESEVKVKTLLDATETVLESNTIYNGGKLGDIDISLPASLDVTYITQVHFSTPEEDAPSFVYDERISFVGDDCEDGVFTPIEWARYSIMIFFDGENPIGMVMRI